MDSKVTCSRMTVIDTTSFDNRRNTTRHDTSEELRSCRRASLQARRVEAASVPSPSAIRPTPVPVVTTNVSAACFVIAPVAGQGERGVCAVASQMPTLLYVAVERPPDTPLGDRWIGYAPRVGMCALDSYAGSRSFMRVTEDCTCGQLSSCELTSGQ